jgi:chemotaxis protein methyltransferase CheR
MALNAEAARGLCRLFEERTGQILSDERQWRLDLSLLALLRRRGLADMDALASRLVAGKEPALADDLVDELLNQETSFFRDRAAFDCLADAAAALAARHGRLRIWCAGVSTGQEAYSLAMLLQDDQRLADVPVEIVATDVSAAAIERARSGLYSSLEIQRGLPVRSMVRWFDREAEGWRANEQLRASVRFRRRALGAGAPIPSRFDLVLCRNVLLYFGAEQRAATLALLADALVPGGFLLLGAGETVLAVSDRLVAAEAYRGLYQRVGRDARPAG